MRLLLALILTVFLWVGIVPVASAENNTLVPCSESPAFIERMNNAHDSYYTTKPFQAYSRLFCGPEGLPHLRLDRLDIAGDVVTPIALFLYIAGWIGWTGRSYLQAIRKQGVAEEKELFIDLPLFVSCMLGALVWPLSAVKELVSGELVAKDEEIPISIR